VNVGTRKGCENFLETNLSCGPADSIRPLNGYREYLLHKEMKCQCWIRGNVGVTLKDIIFFGGRRQWVTSLFDLDFRRASWLS